METPKAYTVTAITRMIKSSLEGSYRGIWVEGEISNYIHHSSGHRYLSLKDSGAVIKLTIWRSTGERLKFEPKNGNKILAYGDISVYEKGGNYQLNVKKLVPVGVGPLELAFRQLYEKLSAEGLFDNEKKQPLPNYPKRVGIVTSPTGAAIRDIINISRRRNSSVQLIIYPAAVQGDGAEETIARGIEYFSQRDDIDLIIIGRGGGSLEDLWPFNTEVTVRAITESRLPIISGVGHEIDTTLSDLAADMRAPTPSAAAELAVWSRREFSDQIEFYLKRQADFLSALVSQSRERLSSVLKRSLFARPMDMIHQRRQYLDNQLRHLNSAGKNRFESHKNSLSLLLSRLDALSPLKTLARGYSVSRKLPDMGLIKLVSDVASGDKMETIVSDGTIVSMVEKIKAGKKK